MASLAHATPSHARQDAAVPPSPGREVGSDANLVRYTHGHTARVARCSDAKGETRSVRGRPNRSCALWRRSLDVMDCGTPAVGCCASASGRWVRLAYPVIWEAWAAVDRPTARGRQPPEAGES